MLDMFYSDNWDSVSVRMDGVILDHDSDEYTLEDIEEYVSDLFEKLTILRSMVGIALGHELPKDAKTKDPFKG